MDVLTVTKFLDAGFTADEIRNMMATAAEPAAPAADPEPAAPAADLEPAAPAADPEPAAPAADPETKPAEPAYLTALNATMNKILTAIQAGNIARNTVPAINNPADIDSQVDKIMAGIIRPEHEKGEK